MLNDLGPCTTITDSRLGTRLVHVLWQKRVHYLMQACQYEMLCSVLAHQQGHSLCQPCGSCSAGSAVKQTDSASAAASFLQTHTLAICKQAQQAEQGNAHLQVVCYTQPLAPALWKTLLKLLNNSMFTAKAALIAALARCEADTWQARGLVQGGPSALQPYLNSVIGQQQSSKSHR